MTDSGNRQHQDGVVLLCFDGSEDGSAAITAAGRLLARRTAVVLTAWEPVSVWAPYDPATILEAGAAKLASSALGLDEIARDMATKAAERGVALARAAGFEAEARVEPGKAWRVVCKVADEIDAAVIVVGARGLSQVQSALLGGVSARVVTHAKRPVLVIPAGAPAT